MIGATVTFVAGLVLVAVLVAWYLRRVGHQADDDYLWRILTDARWVMRKHRAVIEADAITAAAVGWVDLPNFSDFHWAARVEAERAEVEAEILAALDECEAQRVRINREVAESR